MATVSIRFSERLKQEKIFDSEKAERLCQCVE